MTRRALMAFLLLSGGLLTKGSGIVQDSSTASGDWGTPFYALPAAQAAPAGTVEPYQGAMEQRNDVRIEARNSVTDQSVTVNSAPPPDRAIAGLPPGAKPTTSGACPGDMVAVEGEYCTEVRQECKKWLDDPKLPYARCGEYQPESTCVGERVPMHYCMDRYEYTKPGDTLPMNHASFVVASDVCKSVGKRICTESEWNFACEGEEMRPYPYGFERKAVCNQDRPKEELYDSSNKKFQVLADRRMPAGANPDCVSPFGVYDMVGNVDEPVLRESQRYNYPYRNGLKGGWWMPARNRCRPATTKHDDHYEDIQVGVRCCADAPGTGSGATG
jgi:Sulfatase-modifying factor enzyme 1